MITSVPTTRAGSSVRPRRIAASIPVTSAAWMPAVMTTVGPDDAPAMAMYGHWYFSRPGSPANVNEPEAREPFDGMAIGPMFISTPPGCRARSAEARRPVRHDARACEERVAYRDRRRAPRAPNVRRHHDGAVLQGRGRARRPAVPRVRPHARGARRRARTRD